MWPLFAKNDTERIQKLGDAPPLVGPRHNRTKDQYESWCVWHYFTFLARHDCLTFPLGVEKSEAPDFLVRWGSPPKAFGIEVTQAAAPQDQREMTLAGRSNTRISKYGDFGGRGNDGFVGSQVEQMWVADIFDAIKRKSGLRYSVASPILLVYPNGNYAGLHLDQAIKLLHARAKNKSAVNQQSLRSFSKIAIIEKEANGGIIEFDSAGILNFCCLRKS